MLNSCKTIVQCSIVRTCVRSRSHTVNSSQCKFLEKQKFLRAWDNCFRELHTTLYRCQQQKSKLTEDEDAMQKMENIVSSKSLESAEEESKYYNALEKEEELPVPYKSPDIGFWQSERGLVLKEEMLTGLGRVVRMFVSKERSDNWYETAMLKEHLRLCKFNKGDEMFLKEHGPEWAFGLIVFKLGGAVKLKYDDRWVEDVRCLRTPKRRDFRLEAIDLRKSAINHMGLKYLSGTKHIRYINAGDAKCFDDQAMACLHPLADSLEFLDVSGTSVTERGLGYLRLFSNLRYLNLSRLKNPENLERLLPYLLEILPETCCVVTDDQTPSDMYGIPIPFRHPKNPRKDLPITEGNKKIGDLVVYERDMHAVDFYRPETIHELWMTPLMGRLRQSKLYFQQDLDNNFTHKLVHYVIKANNYKPLL